MSEIEIDARMADLIIENEWANSDPFMKSWDDLKALKGIDTNFKRRAQRLEKANATINNVPHVDGKVSPKYIEDAKAVQTGDGAGSKAINPGTVWRNGYGIFDLITPPYNMYELSSYYDTSFANHAAIDAKVSNTVSLGYKLDMTTSTLLSLEAMTSDSARDKAKKRVERLKIQTADWLESCNDDENLTKVLEKVVVDMQATGNGYIEIGRTVAGEIGYIGHIPATTMRVRRLRDGYLQIIGGSVVYFRNFQATNSNPVTTDPRPNEVIHLKEYSPLNTYYGVPDIVAALPSLRGDQMAEQYNIDYFENKAVPRYIITVKGAKLSSDAEDKLFRFFQTNLKGHNHRTLYIPIPGDQDGNKIEFELHPVENSVQEASFSAYRKSNRDNILMAHQVPMSKLGGVDGAGVAAAMSQDRTFRDQVCKPLQEYVAKAINKIVKEKTDILEFKLKEVNLLDEVAQSQIHERYAKIGALVPNEIREDIGKPQREGGDQPMVMSAKEQVETEAEQTDKEYERQRDAERMAQQSDGPAAISGRNPKGEGPKTS